MKSVSVKSLNNSLQNVIKSINPNISTNLINDLKKYQKLDMTKEIVDEYFKIFEKITSKTQKMNIDEDNKTEILKAFSILISLMGQNECMSNVIIATKEEKEKYKQYAYELMNKLQETNNKYNELAGKYNEKELDLELPKITLSITRKNKNIPIKVDEIIEIANNLGDLELEEKFKRFSKKDVLNKNEPNITDIYAKKNKVNQVIQK